MTALDRLRQEDAEKRLAELGERVSYLERIVAELGQIVLELGRFVGPIQDQFAGKVAPLGSLETVLNMSAEEREVAMASRPHA